MRRKPASKLNPDERNCRQCGVLKPANDYVPGRNTCRLCARLNCQAYNKAHPRKRSRILTQEQIDGNRNSRYLSQFGISLEGYNLLLEMQNGVCRICRCPETALVKGAKGQMVVRRLAIDHDHYTGRVRGLLCQGCNTGLGAFRDQPNRLRAAIAYLNDTCLIA